MTALKIIVGVTGSIAAYKSALLIRGLIKAGHEVKVVMTSSARDFISPLTLATLSKNEVHIDVSNGESWNNHVELGLWADLFLVAPCTANTLAKMAHGQCDNMLLATYLSAKCPVWIAPAMDLDMWQHPTTQYNLQRLSSFPNTRMIDVEHGELASGLYGPGRMAEPEAIIRTIEDWVTMRQKLIGFKAMVTAGPTHEHLDPVRYIGNPSSGKMGISLAKCLADMGCKVKLILGPTHHSVDHSNIETVNVTSANEMYMASQKYFPESDLAIFAAAVADYSPKQYSDKKTKKKEGDLHLELKRTEDIAQRLGEVKTDRQITVGFALETNNEEFNAQSKLERKRFNFIVLNSLNDKGAGFGGTTNKVTIYDDNGRKTAFDLKSKSEVAQDIVEYYLKYYSKKI